jgi:hypothetical protein
MAEPSAMVQADAPPALEAPPDFDLKNYFGDGRQKSATPCEYGQSDPCRNFSTLDFKTVGTAPFLKTKQDNITQDEIKLRQAVTAYTRQLYGKNENGYVTHNIIAFLHVVENVGQHARLLCLFL